MWADICSEIGNLSVSLLKGKSPKDNLKPYVATERGPDYQVANVGVYLQAPDPGQGVCPAARRGHFHLNRGPSVPGGVTLATVKAIVPAGSECEKERRSKSRSASN